MFKKTIAIAIFASVCSAPALADHNSKWGEGWANMPNDIHNTRIETRGDNTTFRDFVRHGNGAESKNRYTSETSRARAQADRSRQRSHGRSRQQTGKRR